MTTRMNIWNQKFEDLVEVIGKERALRINDSMTDEMLGINGDVEEEIPSTEEAIEALTDEQFKTLIEGLEEAAAVEIEIIDERVEREEEEKQRIEKLIAEQETQTDIKRFIYDREMELCFVYDLSKRQAQIVARREHGISTEDIMKEFGISKQAVSDAYTKGKQKLIMLTNQM